MRKLFLARISSHYDPSIEGLHLVVVDVNKDQSEEEQMNIAHVAASTWYLQRYPGNNATIHIEQTIDGTIDNTVPGPLQAPSRYSLPEIFRELKYGRKAAQQEYLDELIKEMENQNSSRTVSNT